MPQESYLGLNLDEREVTFGILWYFKLLLESNGFVVEGKAIRDGALLFFPYHKVNSN